MKHLLTFSLLLSCLTLTMAQSPGKGKVSGTITDASTGEPVEYATIAIINPQSGSPVNGTVADGKGKFTVKGIANGKYNVAISFIGFKTQNKSIEITDDNSNIDLGALQLPPDVEVLNEVVVEGQRALVEDKVDRLVYNAENDNTTKGGDAGDVLRRVPMLSVDMDGNVSLRGSENITVLINNRPSTLMASGIADALKQIPADEIKSVEVITSPSAKYSAEGSGGIINIITKKNVLEGANINIRGSAGFRGSSMGVNGGFKKGKLGISLGGYGRSSYNVTGDFENKQFTTDTNNIEHETTQQAGTRSNSLYGNYNLGIDYDINKKNYISSSVRFGGRNSNDYQDGLLSQTYLNSQLNNSSLKNVETMNQSTNVNANFTYTHTFNKPQQELSLLGQYSNNSGTNNFQNYILDQTNNSTTERIKNINNSSNREITFQADYQSPISDNQMIEAGAKQISRRALSDYQYYTSLGEGAYVPSQNNQLANSLNYQQNVSAAYTSYTLNFLTNYSLKAGARYEYTTIDAFLQDEKTGLKIPSYGVLVPSVNFSKKLKNNNTLKASFNRRIQRPSIRRLNPNIQASNPLNITIGNPTLGPEYTNNYELGYTTFIKSTTLNFSTYVRNTNHALQTVKDVIGDTVRTTYQNIGTENSYGASLFATVNVNDKLTLSGGTDWYYQTLRNNVVNPIYNASNQGLVMSARMFGGYKLTDDWSLQFFGFYRGRRVQLQGYRGGFGIYSLSIQKNLPNKRGSFGIGAENFFTPNMRINSETVSPVINQYSTNVMHRLNVKATLSLRFGKIENQASRRKKSIQNDDIKDAGGDNFDAGDAQGAGQQRSGRTPKTTKTKKKKSDN